MSECGDIRIGLESDTQKALKRIWSDALQTDDVSIHKDFIELGGDSLSAMLSISRVKAMFGVELRIRDVLSNELTIFKLAEKIDRERNQRR